jgi:hypothetical protein
MAFKLKRINYMRHGGNEIFIENFDSKTSRQKNTWEA